MAILDKKISEVYAGRDISSLTTHPSKDGITAPELKARFDQLNKEVIPNLNDFIDEQDVINKGKVDLDGTGSNFESVQFQTDVTATPAVGQMLFNADAKTWQFGMPSGSVGDLFREQFYPPIKNVGASTIEDGDFIEYVSADGASGVINVKKASTTLPIAGTGMGLATVNIPVGNTGDGTWFGLVRGIPSDGASVGESWVDGDILYNSGTISGKLSKIKPTAPKPAVMVAIVMKSHATNGQLMVRPMYFPNLTQLSDVYTSAIANGDVYFWNSTNARFENVPAYTKAQVDSALSANSLADRARANHTGTQSADTITDGTTNKAYTSTEKTKLAGIATGAQVNNISDVNATDLTDGGETSLHIHDARYYTKTALDAGQLDGRYYTETESDAKYYSKTEIDNKVASMYKYKGSVANYASLPSSGQVAGDVWNTLDTGQNYAWTGTAWDDIGGTEALASDSHNGLMSSTDYTRLKNVEAGAEVNEYSFLKIHTIDGTTEEDYTATTTTDTLTIEAGLNVSLTKIGGNLVIATSGDIAVEASNTSFVPYGNLTGENAQEALENVSDFLDTILSVTEEKIGAYSANWDADTLETHSASYFATADHNHTGLYAVTDHTHTETDITDLDKYTKSETDTLVETRSLKNWIINGGFDVWQRGTSQTTNGYGSDDRWENVHQVSTKTHSRQAFTDGQTVVPNNPKYFSRTVVTSGNSASSYVMKIQKVEDVTKLSGKTMSYSFWAKADANKNIAIQVQQNFGVGGSAVVNSNIQKIAITNSWVKYIVTLVIPSVSGKTIGDGNHTAIRFWFDGGSDFNSLTDSLGNQSGTFDIANVSLVEGSVPVEWQTEAYADVLRQCQRYYYRSATPAIYGQHSIGVADSSTNGTFIIKLPCSMRVLPTSIEYFNLALAQSGIGSWAVSSMVFNPSSDLSIALAVTIAGGMTIRLPVTLYGVTANTHISFSAEL